MQSRTSRALKSAVACRILAAAAAVAPTVVVCVYEDTTHKNGLFELDVAVVAPAAMNGLPKCPKWFTEPP